MTKANKILAKVFIILCFTLFSTAIYSQTNNFISTGDMENGNWTTNPKNTDLSITFDSGSGIGGTKSLKAVSTNMGGSPNYIIRCDESFSLVQGDDITVSFWAKGSVSNMRLEPWVQENGDTWQSYGDSFLTTEWVQYKFTTTTTTDSDSNFKLKFWGYDTGTIYIDDVQIGPVDYKGVNQSSIYDISVSQNGKTWPIETFINSCPTYQAGFQNMDPKDKNVLNYFSGRSINWAKFNFSSPITVNVKVTNTNKVPVSGQTVNIYPSRHGVTSSTNGDVVTFTITEPGQYSVEIGANGYKNGLILFADPVETDIPNQSNPNYLILNEADSTTISSIPQNYTGVYFRRGVHDIAFWNIPNHIKNVYFEEGSWVYGALRMDANPNVKIFGRGVLSSYKFDYRDKHSVEAINGSNNITIEGLVVADPKYFAVRLIGQNNNVSYTKVIGGWVYNCDGIAAFKGSTVSKSFIWANDDAIKIYRDDITWSDIVVWQLNNGGIIQMSWGGAIGGSTAKNVTVSRLDVLRAEWNNDRFNVGLINCVGNKYRVDPDRSDLLENWLIENVVTETPLPLIWNITPNDYTHCHINGLTMRNWTVLQDNSLGFQNRIKGEDPNNFFSGFVFDNVSFNDTLLTNENRIFSGEMDNGNWVNVSNGTNQVATLGANYGTGNTWGLKSETTNMNGNAYYTSICNDEFNISYNEEVTVSYWARSDNAGTILQPFVQDVTTSDVMWYPQVTLTTNYERYTNSVVVDKSTSDRYKVKFRGFENATIYLDKVQVGEKDWLSLTDMTTRYLDTPIFLPQTEVSYRILANKTNDKQKTYLVYPNPVTDILYLKENEDVYFKVYNQYGLLVLSGQGSQINVSKLSEGLYFLAADSSKPTKFIKL